MPDSTDFIPQEAKIEVIAPSFQEDVENFAMDEEISPLVAATISDYEERFQRQRHAYIGTGAASGTGGSSDGRGLWNLMDWAFRSCINDTATQAEKSIGANEPDTWERAKTGTARYNRQVNQKASNTYAVFTSKDVPFRYDSIDNPAIPGSGQDSEQRERKLNMLAKWSMKKDAFKLKLIEFCVQVHKYGNIPVMTEWKQVIDRQIKRIPIAGTDQFTLEEREVITENRPCTTILPIESVLGDINIGNIQDQECVEVLALAGMKDIIDGIQTGIYRDDLLELLGKTHQWDGTSGFINKDYKIDNRKIDDLSAAGTGKYLKREVFVNLPINEDGVWDEIANIPLRFRVTLFGNASRQSVVARVERNQEPDDAIPIEMIHANPDDSDMLYHISDYEIIRSHISTEMTIIRQTIDNNTLVNKPPMWEVDNEVKGNDRQFGPDARWEVDSKDSIGFIPVRPLTQDNMLLLDYIDNDSNSSVALDKNSMGEAFGSRTSAGEANTISGNTRRPNLVKIEYIAEQLMPFIAKRFQLGWESYGYAEQIVQITDENDNKIMIRPDNLGGEFDIVVDIMDDAKDQVVKAGRMRDYMQTASAIPQLAETTDWVELNKEYQQVVFGSSKYTLNGGNGDVEIVARQNLEAMLLRGETPQFTPGMNLKAHLKIYQGERLRWKGHEDKNQFVEGVLDVVIEQLNQQMADQGGGGGQQGNPTASVANGQELSGAMGGEGA